MAMESIRVFAPATVANVGCGFDVLGFAVAQPGDEVLVQVSDSPGVTITTITGDGGRLPTDPRKNTAGVSILAFLAATGIRQGVLLELHKQMPLGSGLGSSAASAVAGVFAANALFNYPLETRELLPFAMEGERIACGSAHADNVAPALMGGFVLIRSYAPLDIVCIPAPDELYCTLVHPFIEIRTEDARRVLKKYIPLKSAVAQWGNVAGLVTGLLRTDYGLIGRSLQDHVVEPERSLLIPGFAQVKAAATRAGAIGCGISGSGPALFAISTHFETSQTVAGAMKAAFADIKIEARAYVSKINNHGPEIRR
jgi:homoserine kinase